MSPSDPPAQLIVDVGMHRGDDTEFYLRKGFNVLAVEAAPHLVEQAADRFRDAIDEGRLTIVHMAVTDQVGEVDFFISDEDLWSSTRADYADRGFVASRQKVVVPCTTLDRLLAGSPTPYYVKIDVEGSDKACVRSLAELPELPQFVSFEADLTEREGTAELLAFLQSHGYTRFKLVNQATHAQHRLPNPPLEGAYVDVRFTKHMSGPFGEESPGPWMSMEEVRDRYFATLDQQAARIGYSVTGRVLGIPVGRFHRPLMWLYNAPPVAWARLKYAEKRGVEVGGWFDIHAGR